MATFTVARTIRGAGSRVVSASGIVPGAATLVKATLNILTADMTDPNTEVYAGIESSSDSVTWRLEAMTGWKGYAGAPTGQMPYIQLGNDSLDRLRTQGRRARGFIHSIRASNVSADVEVT